MASDSELADGSQTPPTPDQDGGETSKPEWDRGALAVLQREVQSTHLFVWSANAGGVLTSTQIPVSEIADRIRMAGRVLDTNDAEALKMIQAASNSFNGAAQRWEAQARQSEERLRVARAVARLSEAKSRHTAIRTRLFPVQNLFQRAIRSLQEVQLKRRQQTDEA